MKLHMNPFHLFTFSFLLLTLMSCHEQLPDDPNRSPELPPLTFEGKNTLGCKINGKNWVASVGFNLSGDQAFRMGYDSASGHFGINSWWKKEDGTVNQNVKFEAFIMDNIIGNYKLVSDIRTANFIDFYGGYKRFWVDPLLANNIAIIFFNKLKKIIAGTFEFTVIDTINADTLIITEGRFDGQY